VGWLAGLRLTGKVAAGRGVTLVGARVVYFALAFLLAVCAMICLKEQSQFKGNKLLAVTTGRSAMAGVNLLMN